VLYKDHYRQFFFCQKCGNAGNGLCTFESKWHVFINVTISWGYIYNGALAFHVQTSLHWRPLSEMEVRKIPSSYMILLQTSQETLLRMFFGIGGGKCYNTPPYPSGSLFHVHFLCYNKTTKPCFGIIVVCLPPASRSCTYTPI
jgi:hypothetical protein